MEFENENKGKNSSQCEEEKLVEEVKSTANVQECSGCPIDIISEFHQYCEYCSQPLCKAHIKLHSKFCPQKKQICPICSLEACRYCFNCETFLCEAHFNMSHKGNQYHKYYNIPSTIILQEMNPVFPAYFSDYGLNLKSRYKSLRKETCEEIFKCNAQSILIRSPTATGKGSLAMLYDHYLVKLGFKHVYHLSCVSHVMDNEGLNTKFQEKYGFNISSLETYPNEDPIYFIMGYIQTTYNEKCTDFWSWMKTICEKRSNFHLLCFSSYGSNEPGTILSTPFNFNKVWGFDFMRLKACEYDELMKNFQLYSGCPIFDERVKEFIYMQSNGHVGLIITTLNKLKEQFKKEMLKDPKDYLTSFEFQIALSNSRSLVNVQHVLNNDEINLNLKKTLKDFFLGKKLSSEGDSLIILERWGILIKKPDNCSYQIACDWMKNTTLEKVFRNRSLKYQSLKGISLKKVIIETLESMDIFRTQQTTEFEKTLGHKNSSLSERYLKMEFYTALISFLQFSWFVNFDVYSPKNKEKKSKKGKGKKDQEGEKTSASGNLDFLLNSDSEQKWAIKLVKEGGKLEKYLQRFDIEKDGRYCFLGFEDFFVVDFRNKCNKIEKSVDLNPHLLIVEYDPEDMTKIDIFHDGVRSPLILKKD